MKDVPAAVVAIAIVVIAGVAVVDAVRAAVLEEVTGAIPAVAADGEEGKIEQRVDSSTRGRSDGALFL